MKCSLLALIVSGSAVLAIDLQFHGERSFANDFQSPVSLTFGDSLFVRNRNMVIQSTIDARRALDYPSSRPEIDPVRIGVVGYSMGGMIGLYLSALDGELAAVVVCAVPTTRQPLPVDHFNFAARARTPALLMIGRTDWLSSPEDAETLLRLLPQGSELLFYESGHVLPAQFAADAAEWLISRL